MLNDVNPHVEPTITMGSEPAIQRLGEILILRGKLDAANLDRALKVQETARSSEPEKPNDREPALSNRAVKTSLGSSSHLAL